MRSTRAQTAHDVVITKLEAQLATKYSGDDVWTNPGQEKNYEVDGVWPDVVLTDKRGRVRAVYEVETADTFTEEHAIEQWIDYSLLDVPFYLVVPKDREREARRLVRELEIRVQEVIPF